LQSVEFLLSTAASARQRGIAFHVLIAPEKDVVLPELSPNATGKGADSRPALKLAANLNGLLTYPLERFLRQEHARLTFHVRNSHVSLLGGLLLADAACCALKRPPISEIELPTEIAYWPDDLSMKWVASLNTRRRVLSASFRAENICEVQGHTGTYQRIRNSQARSSDTLLIFGDSYSWNPDAGLARLMSFEFSDVHFVWGKVVDWSLVDAVRPAAVFLQSAERFLVKGILAK
jgi:hypothetical protein